MLYALCFMFLCAASAVSDISILSENDVKIYSEIFELQRKEKVDAAKKLDPEISDDVLMGTVLYHRYMSKTYRTSAKELSDWMGEYADLPGADKIYELCKKRKVQAVPPKLSRQILIRDQKTIAPEAWTRKDYSGETAKKIDKFKAAIRSGRTKNARDILDDKKFKSQLSPEDYGRLSGRLGFMYYADGQFELAETFSKKAAESGSEYGLWTIGLLSYKQSEYSSAAVYFEKLSGLPHINSARQDEALFWQARALDAAGEKKYAKRIWEGLSERPQSFYGALAAAMIRQTPRYKFYDYEWTKRDLEIISETRNGRMALAAKQVNQAAFAERHMRQLIATGSSDELIHAVHVVSMAIGLPNASMQAAAAAQSRGITDVGGNVIYASEYPVPTWSPKGGYCVDRALLFAIIKQESGFKTNAKSCVGAAGVMQMMPATAKIVARRNGVDLQGMDMHDIDHNMNLGQLHVRELLAMPRVGNNLIKMLASYNSGPGAMFKFESVFQTDDPLQYIESFPAIETRAYIKRVLANLWLYRARLSQSNCTVQQLADGQWPIYETMDDFEKLRINN
jgi:soluble lytic murein transglycosylase-like protein